MQSFWTTRIYTQRGFVRENILGDIRALDIGSGNRKLPGAIGIDRLKLPNVDVINDLKRRANGFLESCGHAYQKPIFLKKNCV